MSARPVMAGDTGTGAAPNGTPALLAAARRVEHPARRRAADVNAAAPARRDRDRRARVLGQQPLDGRPVRVRTDFTAPVSSIDCGAARLALSNAATAASGNRSPAAVARITARRCSRTLSTCRSAASSASASSPSSRGLPCRRLGPAFVLTVGREQVVLDAIRDGDRVRDVERRLVVRDPFRVTRSISWPSSDCRPSLTSWSDSSRCGRNDSYCARVGDSICTQRIQA